jgi:DNA invertase Pin-like site-specific DNA recombinase
MPRQITIGLKPTSKTAVAYLRVSTDIERQQLGAEAQRTAIAEWARREGAEIASWFVEQVTGSASLERRPVLLQALAEVSVRRASALVVQRLDRFSRDPLTAALAEAELRRHGATLVCADGAGSGDDPTAELIRGILVSVAKFEKSLIQARIKAALAVKKARGEYTGVAPYGFRVGDDRRSLVPHPEEDAVLAQILALRASGLTIREVQAAATERALLSRTRKPFTIAAIHRMLTRTRAHVHTRLDEESETR